MLCASISVVRSGPRREIGSSIGSRAVDDSNLSTTIPRPVEIDNHADTHCFGSNFRPLMWNNVQCSVSPFLDELGSTENIDICTGATAWTHPSGEVFILVFGQGLWFGNRMEKSLINPNQCRAYGVSLCDDPTDPHRDLGFYSEPDDLFIPMSMNGSFCSLLTRCPTRDELERCRHITLSSEEMWDPHSNPFGLPTHDEFSRLPRVSGVSTVDHRHICVVRVQEDRHI